MRTSGLSELIVALWRWGVPVVGWAEVPEGIVILTDGGGMQVICRSCLGERIDIVASSLARQFPRRPVLETPARPEFVPQFSERELAWLRFLRWLYTREGDIAARECPKVR